MFFAAPIWLFGLIPWGIVAVVLLMSRRPRRDVPFLELWRLNAPQESIRRSFSTPPIGVMLALLATLLTILAAAAPAFRRQGAGVLTVVLDTGASMSAAAKDPNDPQRTPRFVRAIERASAILLSQGAGDIPVELIVIPADPGRSDAIRLPASELPDYVARLRLSAADVSADVDRIVHHRLTDPEARVLVVSDRAISAAAPKGASRLLAVPVPRAADNVAIVSLAVRREPSPQAMIRLHRNNAASGSRQLKLRVSSAGQSTDQAVDIAPGVRRDLFVPLPAVGGLVTAELLDTGSTTGGTGDGYADGFSADDRADLVAETDWPVVEPGVGVGELRRLIEVYGRSRPAGERSIRVRLTATTAELGASPGVILAALGQVSQSTRVVRTADHPSLAGVNLTSMDIPAIVHRELPPGDWQPVLFDAVGPLLAVRSSADPLSASETRQVWSAIHPGGWAGRVEYVVFWSALFDWVGGAGDGEHLAAHPLETLTSDWKPFELGPGLETRRFWPGVYQRDDGTRRAFGPAAVDVGNPARETENFDTDLPRMLLEGQRTSPLSGWLTVLALAAAGAAAAVWRRKSQAATLTFAPESA